MPPCSTLEADWNTALRALGDAQAAYDKAREQHPGQLTEQQKTRIRQLVTDLPGIWNDPATPARERKRIAPLAPVAHLGIDEHRRGRPRWRVNPETGEYELPADRWHTCFTDLSGGQRMIGQVQGRTADDAAYWLALAPSAWRDRIQAVCTGMCSIYLSAVRRALPQAQVAVDLFHVVHLAVNTLGDVRRRAIRDKYGRRGRSGDPEYGIKNLLTRNLEHLSPDQFAKAAGTLGKDRRRAADRRRLDRQGETAARPEPARPHHRIDPLRAPGPGQAVRVLRLVRPERRHPRARFPRPDHIPVAEPDRLRGAVRRHERVGFTMLLALRSGCRGRPVMRFRLVLAVVVIVASGSDILVVRDVCRVHVRAAAAAARAAVICPGVGGCWPGR